MEIVRNILRIVIPFEDIFTTVFLVRTEQGVLLFDTATFPRDMDEYVFPVLDRLGEAPKCVFISHNHRDHAGGLQRVLEKYPGVPVASRSGALAEKFPSVFAPCDGDVLLGCLRVVEIPGHTMDSMGLLDERTGTLLTGDSLQLYGIFGSGNWGANIRFPQEHAAAIEKIRKMDVNAIVASHDYHPCGHIARGEAEIDRYLRSCLMPLEEIRALIAEHPEMDDAAIANLYNHARSLPTLGAHVVGACRNAVYGENG